MDGIESESDSPFYPQAVGFRASMKFAAYQTACWRKWEGTG
jgi:hypothetical protein